MNSILGSPNELTKQAFLTHQLENIQLGEDDRSRSKLYMGVDGGGSSTSACVLDGNKRVLGRAKTSASNWNSVGKEHAREAIISAITQALGFAGKSKTKVLGICLGLSGCDRAQDKELVRLWIRDYFGRHIDINISNDAVCALASGTAGRLHGIVCISGTGMIAYGFKLNKAGELAREERSGGWGPMLGDGGSGYQIGQDVLQAACMASDGRGRKTCLKRMVLDHLKLGDPQELITWAYKDTKWARFASLAPLAFEGAARGDPVAIDIVRRATHALAQAVVAVAHKLRFDEPEAPPFPLVLSGGNLEHNRRFAALVSAELKLSLPRAEIVFPKVEQEVGAALVARFDDTR